MREKVKVGVSACLLGEKVRYDGGHKLDHFITDTLGRFFRFVPVCPEVGSGMPTPREPMHLEGDPASPRLVTNRKHCDMTEQMQSYCRKKVVELEREDLCGFIFKKGSPSSGLFRVKVYGRGVPAESGRGIFAAAVADHFPFLPLEEEARLCDLAIRENFIERVFAYRQWQDFARVERSLGDLVEFHTEHKLQIMAHSVEIYRKTGKLVAEGRILPFDELLARYEELFMTALALQATVKKNSNVLSHILGYFKKNLTPGEKMETLEVLRQYHDGVIPLIVPVTLLKQLADKYDQQYLRKQSYLSPHMEELLLRNQG